MAERPTRAGLELCEKVIERWIKIQGRLRKHKAHCYREHTNHIGRLELDTGAHQALAYCYSNNSIDAEEGEQKSPHQTNFQEACMCRDIP